MALKPLNSVAGFSVGEIPANIILANGDITTTNITTTGKANLNAIGNVIITGGSNTQVIQTDGSGNLSFVTINTSLIANGNSNVQVLNNSNITFSSAGVANVVVITSTGMNVAGYISGGNITANGNVSVNNYIVTPATVDLIVAPDTQITRFYSNANPFSGGYSLGNNLARWDNVFANTANMLYANGNPWDLQEAAGANKEIQYNDGSNNFGASANFTFDYATNLLTVNGNAQFNNANLGNLAIANFANVSSNTITNNLTVNLALAGNTANFSGNIVTLNANLGNLATANFVNVSSNTITHNLTVNLALAGNTANFSGNIVTLNANLGNLVTANYANFANDIVVQGDIANANNVSVTANLSAGNVLTDNLLYANGQPWDLQEAAGANTEIQYNDGNDNFGASNAFTFDYVGNLLTVVGNTQFNNANLGNLAIANFVNVSSNTTTNNLAVNLELSGNTANFSGNITTLNANLGNLATANFVNVASNTITNNLTVNLALAGNTANFSGNITSLNANLGNLATANFSNIASNITTSNLTVNLELSGNTANFSGNVILPNLTVNLELAGNTANFTGNIIAANFIGSLANGTSNVKVYNNANVEFTINGTANLATISSTGLYVAGEINTTTGNMLSNGNITANLFLNSANANVTGEAVLGSVKTANITAPTGDITISAAGANQNINLAPTGTGNVDVGLHNITQVALPINPNDAATKEYVDNISQGLFIHPAANVTSTTNLNSTYDNGGTVLSATTIAGNKTITFSVNHGLVADDNIIFTNTFNGIIGGEAYVVYSVPAANQITIKDGYFGAEVTTLVNGSGLSEAALGNGGVGATLTNAGAQAALTIDSILMTVGARVLVQGQTNQFENGIYEVTTVGTGATNWVLTRAADGDLYAPKSETALCSGSYFFIMQGSQYAGSSYVLTSPPGEIVIGVDNIVFSQFSQAGSYTAGNGIAITGTIISANTDNITTAIVSGNIVVKTSANLTTPNIGDATFSSLTWNTLSNGNVTANNLSIGNIANITGNLRVDGIIESNGNVTSNAYINGNNASFTNYANVGGNLLANNITSNNAFSTNTANVTSNLVTSNATVNLEFSGNTANFSGNVIVPNLTVNLQLAGNTANFTGNITSLNANLGNLATANFVNVASNITTSNLTVNLQLAGNTANFTGNITSLNANLGNLATANFVNVSSNTTTNNLTVNLALAGNTANFSGNITTLNANLGNLATANYGNFANDLVVQGNIANANNISVTNLINGNTANFSGNIVSPTFSANTSVLVGNTTITHGNVTTTAASANQTIASFSVTGITGVEYLVKAIDASGGKYSVATVLAVTDGTNADYAVYGSTQLGGYTGSLAVNISGAYIRLQVTPASSNSTIWTTQYRLI